MSKSMLLVWCGALGLLALPAGAAAQDAADLDPCANTVRLSDTQQCWAQQLEQANQEMQAAYEALLKELPAKAGDNLKKAQKLWLDFREAHVNMLSRTGDKTRYDAERFTCAIMAMRQMAKARTAELRRLLKRDSDELCPL